MASLGRILLVGIVSLVFYFLLPFTEVTPLDTLLRLGGGILLLAAAAGWLIRSILIARYPQVRSIESLGLLFWMLVIVFSIVYHSISQVFPGSFTEPLNDVGGLYFTITVLSAVGFGDITPVTDAARIAVSVQMLADLVLFGVIVRVLLGAGRVALSGRSKRDSTED